MAWCGHVQRPTPVYNLSYTYRFSVPQGKEGIEIHDLNASWLISGNVVWLALAHKTDAWRTDVMDIINEHKCIHYQPVNWICVDTNVHCERWRILKTRGIYTMR